ncbi:MAG: hypothetical protein U0573_05695 [Phycisphaerales bacterium]|nr:hypothetical protein [Planctomycetota bacterium]
MAHKDLHAPRLVFGRDVASEASRELVAGDEPPEMDEAGWEGETDAPVAEPPSRWGRNLQ